MSSARRKLDRCWLEIRRRSGGIVLVRGQWLQWGDVSQVEDRGLARVCRLVQSLGVRFDWSCTCVEVRA